MRNICVFLSFVAIAICSAEMEVEKAFAQHEIAPQLIPVAPPKVVTVSLSNF